MERLTREQAAIIGAYTGVACGPFEDIQFLGDRLFGRPTWTHEYAVPAFVEQLKEKVREEFLAICADKPSWGNGYAAGRRPQ